MINNDFDALVLAFKFDCKKLSNDGSLDFLLCLDI